MPFYQVTYNETYRRATFYNYGCTFRCRICSYKLRSGPNGTPGLAWPPPQRFLTCDEMCHTLAELPVDKAYFMGGEPTTAPELEPLLDYARNQLGLYTALGHTNGSKLPLANLDFANVGFKSWEESSHRIVTGRSREPIYANFARAAAAGIRLKANLVLIPGLVEADQAEALARWIAAIDPTIALHLMGYIPVPGETWRKPTDAEMTAAADRCRAHLATVELSNLSVEAALGLAERDDRFQSRRVLG